MTDRPVLSRHKRNKLWNQYWAYVDWIKERNPNLSQSEAEQGAFEWDSRYRKLQPIGRTAMNQKRHLHQLGYL